MKKNTAWVTGERAMATGCSAGDVKAAELTFVIAAGTTLAAADVVGLGFLPAFHHITGAVLVTDALGGTATTANVGFVTGTAGAEVVGTELYSGANVVSAAALQLTSPTAYRLPAADSDREIGLKVSADIASATSDRLVTLVLQYAASGN